MIQKDTVSPVACLPRLSALIAAPAITITPTPAFVVLTPRSCHNAAYDDTRPPRLFISRQRTVTPTVTARFSDYILLAMPGIARRAPSPLVHGARVYDKRNATTYNVAAFSSMRIRSALRDNIASPPDLRYHLITPRRSV